MSKVRKRRAAAARTEPSPAPRSDRPPVDPTLARRSAAVSTAAGESADGPVIEARRFSRRRLLRLMTMDLYVLGSFVSAYVVCALSFISFYVVIETFFKLHKFIPSGVSSPLDVTWQLARSLFQYNAAMIPTIYTNYMGPILTLAAAMFAITFLNRGNEFTAIKAAGVSIYRILVPIFLAATVLAAGTFALQEVLLPRLREPIRNAIALSSEGTVRPPSFYDPVHDVHFTVREYSPDRKIASGVVVRKWSLSHADASKREKLVIDASRMRWVPTTDSRPGRERGHWLLTEGSIQRWNASGRLVLNKGASGFDQLKEPFEVFRLETSLLPIDLETSDQEISYLSARELRAQHRRQPDRSGLLVKLHHHFAFPLSHLILLLLGIPFVINFENRSFVLGLAVAFLVCAGYFLLSSMAQSLASDPGETVLPPIVAAWLPNMLFGALGLTIFTNMRT